MPPDVNLFGNGAVVDVISEVGMMSSVACVLIKRGNLDRDICRGKTM